MPAHFENGFSSDGLQAFGKGKRTLCMDGFDLPEILRRRLSVIDVLESTGTASCTNRAALW